MEDFKFFTPLFYFTVSFMNLLEELSKIFKYKYYEKSWELIESDICKEITNLKSIFSKEDLIEGMYYKTKRINSIDYSVNVECIEFVEVEDFKRFSIPKLIDIIKYNVENLEFKSYIKNKTIYRSIISFDLPDESYFNIVDKDDLVNSKLECLCNSYKYLNRKKYEYNKKSRSCNSINNIYK